MKHKILISDFPKELERDIDWERKQIKEGLGNDWEIECYPYQNQEELIQHLTDAEVLMTAFLPVTGEVLLQAKKLRMIAVNATGYGTIDWDVANQKKIAICPVREYCTQEVAEHTLALMLALQRGLRQYRYTVEEEKRWNYVDGGELYRIEGQTLAIFGFGRIGKAVCKRAKAFGMRILVVDPHLSAQTAQAYGVSRVDKQTALKQADVISSHMNQTKENEAYFSWEEFKQMVRKPIFINASRGSIVEERALAEALDSGLVRGAGLDVLAEEYPKLEEHPLLGRPNVIITPHAAFYSKTSMRKLQQISCENIIHFCKGSYEKIDWIANREEWMP